ncbi:hypothetical protein RNJ44_01388 [Nakaseomyces bracarensis]|uniref:Uncharacterized protein n=1 Tax=Nakaseomyces bracarensis TaxID=273131 RepID=A0ABR4NPJ8_9SACH
MYSKRFKKETEHPKAVLQPKTTNVRIPLLQGNKRVAANGDVVSKRRKKRKTNAITSIVNDYVTLRLSDGQEFPHDEENVNLGSDPELVVAPPASTSTPTPNSSGKAEFIEEPTLRYPEITYNRKWNHKCTLPVSDLRDQKRIGSKNYIDIYEQQCSDIEDSVLVSPNAYYNKCKSMELKTTALLTNYTSDSLQSKCGHRQGNISTNNSPTQMKLAGTHLRRYELIKQAYKEYVGEGVNYPLFKNLTGYGGSTGELNDSSDLYESSGGKATYNDSPIGNN